MIDLKEIDKNIKVLIDNGYTPPFSKTLVRIFEELVSVIKDQEDRLASLDEKIRDLQHDIRKF